MVEANELKNFFGKCAENDMRKAFVIFVENLGLEFLAIIQDEIIRKKIMDTRLLLSSFHKADGGGIWELSEGDLTVTVGTNVDYARYVNDGHWTCKKGEAMRFVPGVWEGGRFIYTPGAKTGMILKQKIVRGKHFWEGGIKIFEKMLPSYTEKLMNDFLKSYFG